MVSKQAFTTEISTFLVCDGDLLSRLTAAGTVWLQKNHQHVNNLNVFPVPDGDTGTNMLLTMREAYRHLERAGSDNRVDAIANAVAFGALNGARGNSGTILSQLWQGFASSLRGHNTMDAKLFAEACKNAIDLAYKAVTNPTEGTILTVSRQAMEAVVKRVEAGEKDLLVLLKVMSYAARRSLRNTPNLLPILKQAGVVDSGGQGFVYILEGMKRYLSGKLELIESFEETVSVQHDEWQQTLQPEDEEGYGYDVQFRMHGSNLDVDAIRKAIDDIGWSTVVVGNDRLVKVHVHVFDPGKPISYAISLGVDIDDVVVENMQMQFQDFVGIEREEETQQAIEGVAVIAVAPGNGLRRLFTQDLQAACVVSGGQTMNPSTGDFLSAINSIKNTDIILLPNNKNIVLAAQQAAKMVEDRRIRVVPTRTIPQGISAMMAYANLRDAEDIDAVVEEMQEAVNEVVSAEITTATRNVEIGGVSVREGQLIGLLEGSLVVAGQDMLQVMRDLLVKAQADKRELITLYYGSDTHKAKAQILIEALSDDYPDQVFEVVYGGQSLYPYIISLE